MTQRTKGKRKKQTMQEVKKVTEPDRPPMHCGVPMRRFQGVASGDVKTRYICAKDCGAQLTPPTPVKV